MDLIVIILTLLPWILLAYKFHNIFCFLVRIENTMSNMNTILKDAGVTSQLPQPAQSEVETKRQRLLNIVAAGQCKLFFGKEHTLASIEKATEVQINKLFEIYESKYSALVSSNILDRFLELMGRGIGRVAPIDNSQDLSEDYKSDFIIKSELQKVTGRIAYMWGPLLATFSAGLITAKHIDWKELREKINFPSNITTEDGDCNAGDAPAAPGGYADPGGATENNRESDTT